ncbi:cytochrome C oxidase subunit IV family protein [Nocardia sp. BMG51109]|uniref:cytochrome C oxidase subunit IV family protein n=1 Tax=Nocardia sp. BMG51109 TaxID=1056816 RepID=UPI000463F2CC|nr:cytochrome C oxidase subunit IV family protein [Nocardia sp. BMG51109]
MTTQSVSGEKTTAAKDKRSVLVAWAMLTAMTVLAWRLTPGHAGPAVSDGLVVGIVVLGMIKCRLIIRYFMEIRFAPRWLRIATDAWLGVVWVALLGIHLY